MNKIIGAAVILAVAAMPARAASGTDRWIHIRVDDAGDDGARVDIQVPLGLVSGLLPMIQEKHPHRIEIDGKDVDLEEMRGYWNQVRAAKDGQYVTVRDTDADVRISKSGGMVLVRVDDREDGGRVRMKVPIPVVDAFFARGGEIDVEALGAALAKAPSGDLLTVEDEDSHVRIWIDAQPSPAREEGP